MSPRTVPSTLDGKTSGIPSKDKAYSPGIPGTRQLSLGIRLWNYLRRNSIQRKARPTMRADTMSNSWRVQKTNLQTHNRNASKRVQPQRSKGNDNRRQRVVPPTTKTSPWQTQGLRRDLPTPDIEVSPRTTTPKPWGSTTQPKRRTPPIGGPQASEIREELPTKALRSAGKPGQRQKSFNLSIRIRGREYNALVDSGAEENYIDPEVVNELRLR